MKENKSDEASFEDIPLSESSTPDGGPTSSSKGDGNGPFSQIRAAFSTENDKNLEKSAGERKSVFSALRWVGVGSHSKFGQTSGPDQYMADSAMTEVMVLPYDAAKSPISLKKHLSLQHSKDWIQHFHELVRSKDNSKDVPVVTNSHDPRQKLQKCITIDVLDQRYLPKSNNGDDFQSGVARGPGSEVISMVPATHVDIARETNNTTLVRNDSKVSVWSASTIGIEKGACRICYSSSLPMERTLRVCHCITYVHPSCLMKWLETAKLDHCEVCQFKFTIAKKIKPFYQWTVPKSVSSRWLLHGLFVAFILYTIFYLWGMTKAVDNFFMNIKHGRALETSGVLTLIVIGTIIFILMFLKVADTLIQFYHKWKLPNLALYLYVDGEKWQYQDLKF